MKYIIISLLMLLSISGFSSITSSIQTGNWSVSGTWSNGVPGCGDTIVISLSHTVTVDVQVDLSSCTDSNWVKIYGTLTFNNGKKLKLACGSSGHIYPGGSVIAPGGGGNSTIIEICGVTLWTASDGSITSDTVIQVNASASSFPVQLISFTIERYKNEINIFWQTASETNSDYYILERSLDLQSWEVIGELAAAGNSNLLLDYSFIDHNPQIGSNYYRLLQVDFDGKYEYFGPIHQSFTTNSEIESINIYPNPNTNGILSITYGGSVIQSVGNIEIYDYSGKLIMSQKMKYNDNPTIDISQLSKGVYLLQYISNQQIISKKLIIQ